MRATGFGGNRPVRSGELSAQAGQAMVEGLVVAGVLGSLVAAVLWLGGLQDVGLQLQHASRRVAFGHAHQGLRSDRFSMGVDGYLASAGHEWRMRRGDELVRSRDPGQAGLDGESPVRVGLERLALEPTRQPGDGVAGASRWRAQLRLGDANVWRASVSADTGSGRTVGGALHDFDRLGLGLRRHTAILSGTGAASDDPTVQRNLSDSEQAWGRLADVSRREGLAVEQRVQALDGAWGRALPNWDWLGAWAGEVPFGHLQPWRKP
ncbi:MAG: hypothetical protein EPN31_02280 [Castellaniella sp.]|uniref:hypothetical protein n=1 Tax=Castellaniella sp. TaxID=1955812 RepID=UPI00120810B1|nr:hypothetical protein [Castellaniella sp.]TAN30724.1 MAG: hypothetical protein EPN31_02280 [Castellaniella sp.]